MKGGRKTAARNGLQAQPLARGMASLGISQVAFILCSYIFYIFLARTRMGKAIRASSQDPTTAGLMGVNINSELFTYGTRDSAVQYINRFPGNFHRIHRSFLRLQVYLSLGITILVYLFFLPLAFISTKYDNYFFIAFLDLPLMGFYMLWTGYLNGFRLFTRQATSATVYSVTKMVFIIFFVQLGWRVGGALFGNIFSTVFAFATALLLLHPKMKQEKAMVPVEGYADDIHEEALSVMEIAKSSFTFILIPLFYNLMMSMDLWIINLLRAGETSGYYMSAVTIAKTIFFLFSTFYMALFPATVASLQGKEVEKSERLFELAFTLFFHIALPTSLLMAFNAERVTLLIYGAAYAPSAPLIEALSLAYLFLTMCVYFVYILFAGGHRSLAVRVLLAITLIDLPLIYALARWRGAPGAAWGTTIATFCGMILSYLLIQKKIGLSWRTDKVTSALALAILSFLPLALIPSNRYNFIPLSILFATIYFLVLDRTSLLKISTLRRWLADIFTAKRAAPPV